MGGEEGRGKARVLKWKWGGLYRGLKLGSENAGGGGPCNASSKGRLEKAGYV